jgi:transcriptional regulator with XRE-family HTH domain
LRTWRERRFLTQEELARRAGVSRATIYKAEAGGGVAAKTGRALADALGIGPEDLLENAEDPKVAPPQSPSPQEEAAAVRLIQELEIITSHYKSLWEEELRGRRVIASRVAEVDFAILGLADLVSSDLRQIRSESPEVDSAKAQAYEALSKLLDFHKWLREATEQAATADEGAAQHVRNLRVLQEGLST